MLLVGLANVNIFQFIFTWGMATFGKQTVSMIKIIKILMVYGHRLKIIKIVTTDITWG